MSRLPTLLVAVATACVLSTWTGSACALPPNTRQIDGGYWLGGTPEAADIDALWAVGVRTIVSLTPLPAEASTRASTLGMRRTQLWFGLNFPKRTAVAKAFDGLEPASVFFHCEWGADRTGSLAAYLLATRQGWPADQAFLAVIYPADKDIARLVELLEADGFAVTDEEVAELAGLYSGASTGGTGGLKVRSDGYRTTIRSTLQSIRMELLAVALQTGGRRGGRSGTPQAVLARRLDVVHGVIAGLSGARGPGPLAEEVGPPDLDATDERAMQ